MAKTAKEAKWKTISRDGGGDAIAASPRGTFVAYGSFTTTAGAAPTMAIAIHHKNGESITAPVPGVVGGLAVLPDERIVASIREAWPVKPPNDYAAAGLVIMAPTGEIVGRIADPALACATSLAVDASGTRLAVRLEPRTVVEPNYGTTTVAWTTVDDVLAGRPVTHTRAFAGVVPSVAYAPDGTLLLLASKALATVAPDGAATGARAIPLADEFYSPGATADRPGPYRLSAAGPRVAAFGAHDHLIVAEGDRVVLDVPAQVASHAVLCGTGETLITAARAAKARLGKQLEASTPWPDPAMAGDYLAAWDVDARTVRRVVPRASGQIQGIAVVPGDFVAVATVGNKYKIEFFAWADLVG